MPRPELTARQQDIMDKLNERRAILASQLPKPPGEIGGLFGQAIHLGKYQWEGLAMALILEELYFIMSILFAVTFMEDNVLYDKIDDMCKIDLDNYDPEQTPIFGYTRHGGIIKLDIDSGPLRVEDITPLHLVANGYMHAPNVNMSYRKRWGEFLTTMMGGTCDPEWDAVYDSVKKHGEQAYNDPHSPFKQGGVNPAEYEMMRGPGR
jgi:hypothetical protein